MKLYTISGTYVESSFGSFSGRHQLMGVLLVAEKAPRDGLESGAGAAGVGPDQHLHQMHELMFENAL